MDRDTFDSLNYALFPLVLSWFHTENLEHGQHAVLLLRTYFLDPATRMNASTGLVRASS